MWDPHHPHDIDALEKVQRRAALYVTNNYQPRESVTNMIADLGWQPLQDRRRAFRLSMLFKIQNGLVGIDPKDNLQQPVRKSRSSNTNSYTIPRSRIEAHKMSFYPNTIRDWNGLQPDVQAVKDLQSFKACLF